MINSLAYSLKKAWFDIAGLLTYIDKLSLLFAGLQRLIIHAKWTSFPIPSFLRMLWWLLLSCFICYLKTYRYYRSKTWYLAFIVNILLYWTFVWIMPLFNMMRSNIIECYLFHWSFKFSPWTTSDVICKTCLEWSWHGYCFSPLF